MKNNCLNVWKGIAAFMVILIHCSFPSPVGGAANALARFGVPLFFMTSGYFCYGRDQAVIRRRIRRTLGIFLAANGVYFFWKLLMLWRDGAFAGGIAGIGAALFGGSAGSDAMQGLLSPGALWDWLFWNQSPFMYHLWFIGALLYAYLLYALLQRHGWERSLYPLIPVTLAANLLFGEGLGILGHGTSFLFTRNFWLTGLPFFLWGHWFAHRQAEGRLRGSVRSCLGVTALGALLSLAEMVLSGGTELYLGSILMSGGLFTLALLHPEWGRGSILARVGERDYQHIYLWHLLVYDILQLLASAAGVREHIVYLWLMPVLVCLLSWALAEVLQLSRARRIRN